MINLPKRNNIYFTFMPKHQTYNYLKDLYKKKKRVVISRYGDGEYFIISNEGGNRISKQIVTDEFRILLSEALNKKGQLICLPSKNKIDPINLYLDDHTKFSTIMSKFIISVSDHSLYGQGQWRMIDFVNYKSKFITNFFLEKTLVVTGHSSEAKTAFHNEKNIEIFETPIFNAIKEYKQIIKDLKRVSKKFDNIIFGCGPLAKVLISDLINVCDSNLIDLGSIVGIIVNPFSQDKISPVMKWSGFGKKGNPEVVERCSKSFFETLKETKKWNNITKRMNI